MTFEQASKSGNNYNNNNDAYAGLVKGSLDLVVSFDDKYYAMANATQRAAFLKYGKARGGEGERREEEMQGSMAFFLLTPVVFRKPHKYTALTFPKKLPPPQVSIPLDSLPVLGYLGAFFSFVVLKKPSV